MMHAITKLLSKLFSESDEISMVRVMAFICCITAVMIAHKGMCSAKPDYPGMSMLCGTFLGAAFGGKIMQKRYETKPSDLRPQDTSDSDKAL